MAEPSTNDDSQLKAPKDKNCQFCGQAFTSSSLGRHLDLYIREKNPKPPDGVHDVKAIREIRGHVTRRQHRSVSRREVSMPSAPLRPSTAHRESPAAEDAVPRMPNEGKFPFSAGNEGVPVVNNVGEMRRTVSRQVTNKINLDSRQRMSTIMDQARATEMALREIVSLFKAAKQIHALSASPFDFNPFEFDFAPLVLQCLKPPPTLFSSTQHPTTTSWSLQPPDKREYDALVQYFTDEFKQWKSNCATQINQINQELMTSPLRTSLKDARDAAIKAERDVDDMVGHVTTHLQLTYAAWNELTPDRKREVWVLELARTISRRNKTNDELKQANKSLIQEVSQLKNQVEQLTKGNLPKEFQYSPPVVGPIDPEISGYLFEIASKNGRCILNHINVEDDISTIIGKAVERWKSIIIASRTATSGMNAQKTLDGASITPTTPVVPQANMSPAIANKEPSRAIPKNRSVSRAAVSQKAATAKAQAQAQDKAVTATISSELPRSAPGAKVELAVIPQTMDTSNVSDPDADGDGDADMDGSADADVTLGVSGLNVGGDGGAGDVDSEMQDGYLDNAPSPAVAHKPFNKTPMMPVTQQGSLEIPRTRAHQSRNNGSNGGAGGVAGEGRFLMQNGHSQAMNNPRAVQNMNVGVGQSGMPNAVTTMNMSEDMFMS